MKLSFPAGDGKKTLRAHLQQVEKQTGKAPEGLEGPDLPFQLEHVWEWFLDMHAARGSNGMGESPITYLDIDAWIRVNKTPLTPFEVKVIRRLDNVYLKLAAQRAKKGVGNG